MDKTSNHYILIMCGGSGPRLWPLSRAAYPKQFLQIFSGQSLIKDTFDRFSQVVPPSNIFFVSHQKYLPLIKKEFSRLVPSENFITEPQKKNTALAILRGTIKIQKINPQAIITTTPSDHFVKKLVSFKKDLFRSAAIANNSDKIVTIGIKPTYPNPGFGYILTTSTNRKFQDVIKFVEKPTTIDAQILIRKHALWNSGIYTFTPNTLISEFNLHQKIFLPVIKLLTKNKIKQAYKLAPTRAIDKAISEKSVNLLNIEANFSWSDIGEWHSIWQHLNTANKKVTTLNQEGDYLSLDSKNCLVSTTKNKLVGLIGVNNLAIIDTIDGLLVCNLNDTYAVRKLVKKIVTTPSLKKYFLTKNDS